MMAEQYTEEEEALAQQLLLADEELSRSKALREARQRLAEQKQAEAKPTQAKETAMKEETMTELMTLDWNAVENYLRNLGKDELAKFNIRYTELYKQLTDPKYAAVVEVKDKLAQLEKEMDECTDLAEYKKLQLRYKNLTRHLAEAVEKAAKPNRAAVAKSYKLSDGKIVTWNGRGTRPHELDEYLKSKEIDLTNKSEANKKKIKELLARIEVNL